HTSSSSGVGGRPHAVLPGRRVLPSRTPPLPPTLGDPPVLKPREAPSVHAPAGARGKRPVPYPYDPRHARAVTRPPHGVSAPPVTSPSPTRQPIASPRRPPQPRARAALLRARYARRRRVTTSVAPRAHGAGAQV